MSTLRGSLQRRRAPALPGTKSIKKTAVLSQEQTQSLFNYVHDEYLDNHKGHEIDWRWVGKHIKVDGNICKEKFYEIQKGLVDHTQPRSTMWTRKELEKVVRTARKVEQPHLLISEKRKIDWTKLAKMVPGRKPEECKRIYETQSHLCRARIGAPSFKVQVFVIIGVFTLVAADALFDVTFRTADL
ncbi:hypothetical protein GGH91_004792 [Coemansia sp. RSA 2671]|nr:hypothetical protein GGH91_004792 [Coemansia sp. RSA 2671]